MELRVVLTFRASAREAAPSSQSQFLLMLQWHKCRKCELLNSPLAKVLMGTDTFVTKANTSGLDGDRDMAERT